MIPSSKIRDRAAAVRYIQRYFLPSSALLGMIGMVGVFLLSMFQWNHHTLYTPVFTREMTIALMGALLSLLHSRYQFFLFENFPEHYRELEERAQIFRIDRLTPVVHPRRTLVQGGYVLGILAYAGTIYLLHRGLSWIGILSFALAGFFVTRVVFWKKVVDDETNASGREKS